MKRNEVDIDKLSPMMRQYMSIKDKYPEEFLFFRLGDFYELFFEDGEKAAHELELTLTGKNAGLDERIPMCGVPFHSAKPYIEKLITKGYKVAVCEQLEDAKNTKGVVKRGVVQVISKGTFVDLDFLNDYDHNYIGSILDFKHSYVLTYSDISTGDLYVSSIVHDKDKLLNEVLKLNLKEVILLENFDIDLTNTMKENYGIGISFSDEYLEEKYQHLSDKIEDIKLKMGIKHLLFYLVVKELKDLSHIEKVVLVNNNNSLELDVHTIRNLELTETLRLKERTYSLFWLIDKAKTAMGSRKLRSWLINPLIEKDAINERYKAIEDLNNEFILKEQLRDLLYEIYDLERLCGKIICGNLNARDLLQIKNSLKNLPQIKEIVEKLKFEYHIKTHSALFTLLDQAINENPPLTLKEGSLIKDNYNKELDELKSIRSGGKNFISNLESEERKRTGIKNLKVGYNKVFGYFLEVTKGQINQIKSEWDWERRQTLTDKERYITPLLKEHEAIVLNSEEKIIELEYSLFMDIKEEVKKNIYSLKELASEISEIDALISLAVVAEENSFTKPILTEERVINITNGRHPVVEKVNKNEYVPNDCQMDLETNTLIITGPNMSGKSTYMRQLAIIIILAQIGSFVPAETCFIPVFDKIFTRIGASDDLVSGQSTFMVEMLEAKNAIINATENSLILFDELGRGTATYDGMSLAESILEYINLNIKCKTLFSTHYHELTQLDKKFPNIQNIHVAALEEDNNITFLHKVKNGAVDKSYGIQVARLAGMPEDIVLRAGDILDYYEKNYSKKQKPVNKQLAFALNEKDQDQLREKLKTINPLEVTPIEAINILHELKILEKE